MTTDITELAAVLRLAAESEIAYRAEGDTSDLWQDEASPDNVLALVEALEKAQKTEKTLESRNRRLDGIITAAEKRIAELESRTVTVKLQKDHVDDADLFGWGVVVVPLEALKEACADAGVTVEITDAGIKWEAE
ncbi:hypothetical protein ACOSHH_001957 [Klebsiella aerogenes]